MVTRIFLTDEQKKYHVERDANVCPYCQSPSIGMEEDVHGMWYDYKGITGSIRMQCRECGFHWKENWKIASIEEIHTP